MNLYGKKSNSIIHKISISILEIVILYLAYLISFQKGGEIV